MKAKLEKLKKIKAKEVELTKKDLENKLVLFSYGTVHFTEDVSGIRGTVFFTSLMDAKRFVDQINADKGLTNVMFQIGRKETCSFKEFKVNAIKSTFSEDDATIDAVVEFTAESFEVFV